MYLPAMITDQIQPGEIFFPYASERRKAVTTNGRRLVHYTRADAAINILKSKSIWMRKASCMNDFMEVQHGLECLAEAYRGEAGADLKATLNGIFNGITGDLERLFDGWQPFLRRDTYVTCFSEHLNEEDDLGRLSMWRAYGGTTGVALVVNTAPFFSPSDALRAYSSPVAYLDDKAFGQELLKLADHIKAAADFVRALGRETVTAYLFNAFKFAALCTKHPGFREEMEWRMIYTPAIEKSPHLLKEVQVINGTPQSIYKIPLPNLPNENLVGIEVPELLQSVIIGPTDYAPAIREAFESLLADAGVDDPASRIRVSDIPLRV